MQLCALEIMFSWFEINVQSVAFSCRVPAVRARPPPEAGQGHGCAILSSETIKLKDRPHKCACMLAVFSKYNSMGFPLIVFFYSRHKLRAIV